MGTFRWFNLGSWLFPWLLLLVAAVSSTAQAQPTTFITWKELDPGFDVQSKEKPISEAPATRSSLIGPQSVAPLANSFDPLADGGIPIEGRGSATFDVSSALLDSLVTIDGYALPLRRENGRVVEFLLVPWVGACIHTPAPPPNQIIHVDYPEGFEAVSMFTPLRLSGRLTHWPAYHELFLVDGSRSIPTSYAMEQAVIGGTPGEIIAAETATANLSWIAAVQSRITEVFTSAMTRMEQGRSAGAIGLALLIAFAYGALHTLGPGHGKAVVVSYFIGAGGSLKRGVVMGMRIAAVHVLSAIVVVFVLDLAVRQATGAAPSDYRLIRLGSYALIVAIGTVMLWHAIAGIRAQRAIEAGHDAHHHHHTGYDHAGCAACASAHAKPRGAGWIAAAVGVVPCTGALIVMLFGLANDLVVPAIMMVIAISAGMAVAMSALGVAAILGRNWSEARLGSTAQRRLRFEAGARLAGAISVLAIGSTLFAATLVQAPATESLQNASTYGATYVASRDSSPEGGSQLNP